MASAGIVRKACLFPAFGVPDCASRKTCFRVPSSSWSSRPSKMIKVENLTKRYGTATAVEGISFDVAKGEIVGFLRPQWRRQKHHHEDAFLLSTPDLRPGRGGRIRHF